MSGPVIEGAAEGFVFCATHGAVTTTDWAKCLNSWFAYGPCDLRPLFYGPASSEADGEGSDL